MTRHGVLLILLFVLHARSLAQVTEVDELPMERVRPPVDFVIADHTDLEGGGQSVRYHIMNNTRDTIVFLMMSCSMEDLFVLEERSVEAFMPRACDKNVPVLVRLAPRHLHIGSIQLAGSSIKPGCRKGLYKIGWRYIAVVPGMDLMDTYRDRAGLGTILWSDPQPW